MRANGYFYLLPLALSHGHILLAETEKVIRGGVKTFPRHLKNDLVTLARPITVHPFNKLFKTSPNEEIDNTRVRSVSHKDSPFCIERGGANPESKSKLKPKPHHGKSNYSFPISKTEFPQFACMSTMMFLFIYVFTTVRDTKDALVVSNCGAEAIPFLKLYGVTPCATLLIIVYSKMSNVFAESKATVFYLTLLPFFIFYTIFAFILYPLRSIIHFESDQVIANASGSAMALLRYWSFSLYFIMSELWASAGVPLLFWTCANDVTSMSEAKRFYPLFAVVGNLAPIISGKVMSAVVASQKTSDDVGFGSTLKILVSRIHCALQRIHKVLLTFHLILCSQLSSCSVAQE